MNKKRPSHPGTNRMIHVIFILIVVVIILGIIGEVGNELLKNLFL